MLKAHPAPPSSELQGSGRRLLLIRHTAETWLGARAPHQKDRRLPPHLNYVTSAREKPFPLTEALAQAFRVQRSLEAAGEQPESSGL